MEYLDARETTLGAKLGRLPRGLGLSVWARIWLLEASDKRDVLPRDGRPLAIRSVARRAVESWRGMVGCGSGRAPPGRVTRLSRRFAR